MGRMGEATSVMRCVLRLIRLCLSGIFLVAGATKVADPFGFARQVENYRIVPHTAAVVIAFYLPWLEITSAIALWLPRVERGALVLMVSSVVLFIFAQVSAMAHRLDITCGCFGAAPVSASLVGSFGRNIFLLAAVVILASAHRRAWARRPDAQGEARLSAQSN
jgi:putative oxidoreductase